MSRLSARIALLALLLAYLAAVPLALADGGPAGQFLPSLGDRDGDGLPDAADCAADDPTRPARAGVDLDCNGAPDAGGGIEVGIAGPVDGAPDPGEQEAASKPAATPRATRAAARRALGAPVVALRLPLGSSVAAYAPARPDAARPALVLVGRSNAGVTVRPVLVLARGERALAARTRSLTARRALVVRVRAPRTADAVRFAVTVTDLSGARHGARRTVRVR